MSYSLIITLVETYKRPRDDKKPHFQKKKKQHQDEASGLVHDNLANKHKK